MQANGKYVLAKCSFQHHGQLIVWRIDVCLLFVLFLFFYFFPCQNLERWKCFVVAFMRKVRRRIKREVSNAPYTSLTFPTCSRGAFWGVRTIVNHARECNLRSKCFLPIPIWCCDIGKKKNGQLSRSGCASRHSLLGAIFVQACKTFIQHLPTLTAPNKPTTPIHLHPPPPSRSVPLSTSLHRSLHRSLSPFLPLSPVRIVD